ncbi:Membrane protein involved in the export of O-antigen and teichoic acid [Chitinophaga costaii]|uniref:Membrane protein involved in the export of O-antigen and teichoic acid n=1 Tax=Chitinophaga costaii TaxID=1335309 RepID=A0A1C4ECD5_9BACT|nr:lipopolysaccharide biosynthesis protein [Chitinophaga costaii]PUZ23910.1 lipopolysaccharide biosynthesis protein [Chitinophaga costaii]SCC41297.1 Membrane protein involved in the export of O-antigen and teichoic acid [Chitinophaga costaii]
MSAIKKQSILSSLIIYIGFAIGALNTLLFVNLFTPEQYGLTRIFADVSQTFYILASLGSVPLLYKFYPYYRDRLERKERDLFSLCLGFSLIGFTLLVIGTLLFKGLIIRKFSANSQLFIDHFNLIYPLSFFLMLFSLLEAHAWNMHRSAVANFYKELGLRLCYLVIIVLFVLKFIPFSTFITLYCWAFAIIFLGLFIYLARKHEIELTLTVSKLTRRIFRRLLAYNSFVFLGATFTIIAKSIDTVMVASIEGIGAAGVFSFYMYITSLMEAPQRGIISASIPVVAKAWKDKNLAKIQSLYQKSSINMLAFSSFLLGLIWLNFDNVFSILHLKPTYYPARYLVLWLGFKVLVELGTGINTQILATSRYWKMDFISTVVLLLLEIPLNYILLKRFGLSGLAAANLIAYTVFNGMRFIFIWIKFGLQPFTWKTLQALAIALLAYFPASAVRLGNPWLDSAVQTVVFLVIFTLPTLYLNISEEITQLVQTTYRRALRLLKR